MSIVNELEKLNKNLTNSYIACNEKGATLPIAQNFDNLSTTIESIFSGGIIPTGEINITLNGLYDITEYASANVNIQQGTEVNAINFTGSEIINGDKVFLLKNANIPQSMIIYNNSPANNSSYINPAGTVIFYSYTSEYIISTNETINFLNSSLYSYPFMPIRYDNYGNMFKKNVILTEGQFDINIVLCQDNYAFDFSKPVSSSTTLNLYKVNPKDNFSILKTWIITNTTNFVPSQILATVIGNKLYISTMSGNIFNKVGIIDENNNIINIIDEGNNKVVLYSTFDNKIAIVCNKSQSTVYYNNVSLVNINDDYTLGDLFISANIDLNNLLSMNDINIVFNRNTGILCISYVNNGNYFGIFKYKDGDFITINITLQDFIPNIGQILSISQDMSKLVIGKYLYILNQVANDTYKAIPYTSYNISNNILTGFAKDSAVVGENFTAVTLINNN